MAALGLIILIAGVIVSGVTGTLLGAPLAFIGGIILGSALAAEW